MDFIIGQNDSGLIESSNIKIKDGTLVANLNQAQESLGTDFLYSTRIRERTNISLLVVSI